MIKAGSKGAALGRPRRWGIPPYWLRPPAEAATQRVHFCSSVPDRLLPVQNLICPALPRNALHLRTASQCDFRGTCDAIYGEGGPPQRECNCHEYKQRAANAADVQVRNMSTVAMRALGLRSKYNARARRAFAFAYLTSKSPLTCPASLAKAPPQLIAVPAILCRVSVLAVPGESQAARCGRRRRREVRLHALPGVLHDAATTPAARQRDCAGLGRAHVLPADFPCGQEGGLLVPWARPCGRPGRPGRERTRSRCVYLWDSDGPRFHNTCCIAWFPVATHVTCAAPLVVLLCMHPFYTTP